LLLAAYVAGSFPTAYLAGRARGVDLRREGSGNLGATNTFRVLGPAPAAGVVAIDMAKGFLPVWFFADWDGSGLPVYALLYGLCAIAGHVWSVFLRFEGGKGVATAGGVLIALAPLAMLISVLVWIGTLLVTRTASVASLVAVTIVPPVAYLVDAPPGTIGLCTLVAGLVWWTHRGNLARLRSGQEHRFGARRPTSTEAGKQER